MRPNFIEQGDAVTCAVGDATLCVRDWHKDKKTGIKVCLTFQNGTGLMATDRVTLGSQKSRSRFIDSLPEEHRGGLESVLFSLDEYLRAKITKSQTKDDKTAVTLTDDEKQESLNLQNLISPRHFRSFVQPSLHLHGIKPNYLFPLSASQWDVREVP